ncbi:MAG TPA: hypothetical protein VMV93_05325 [Chloroflexota bacterium]|nr:hypothetical protein [Chloroflexota bacterium]
MTLEEHLAVPYVLAVEAVQHSDGEWVRRAWHPELPGCVVEADSIIDAIDKLDEERVRYIVTRLERGDPIPVNRPPLLGGTPLSKERLGFAKWLVDNKRLGEQ